MAKKCKALRCEVTSPKKIRSNGYCDKHDKLAPTSAVASTEEVEDYASLKQRVTDLEAENSTMKTALKAALKAIDEIRGEMNFQRTSINKSNYQRDELEQYGRKESGRVIEVKEEPLVYNENGGIKETEDCAQVVIDAAAIAGVKIEKGDIQRAHRVGRRKKPSIDAAGNYTTPKPRQIIFKMKDYGKRMNIIKSKRKFREKVEENGPEKFKNAFFVEDLTPLRSKLLWYAKNECNRKFINCHTKEGKILAQTKESQPGEWISLSSPEDFHKHNIDVDIDVINARLKKIQVLKHVSFEPLSNLLQ